MRSSCVRGRSRAISVGAGEGGSAGGQEDRSGISVEPGSMEFMVVLGLCLRGGVAGVEGWAANEDDVPLHLKSRPRDDEPAVGWELCSNASSWRRFPSDEEPSTELERAKGEKRGAMTTSDVVASVITTTSLEGRDGKTRLSEFKRRHNGLYW
jgi:hypothetical protein